MSHALDSQGEEDFHRQGSVAEAGQAEGLSQQGPGAHFGSHAWLHVAGDSGGGTAWVSFKGLEGHT